MRFRARNCASCGLRFPVQAKSELGAQCPICGGPTEFVDDDYGSDEAPRAPAPQSLRLEALLDNVRSVRNVGSMFRTADGAGVQHLHLAGFTPTPEHPQMAKTSLGAEKSVAWTHYPDAVVAATRLSSRGDLLVALEGGPRSESFFDVAAELAGSGRPLVLVLGHEVSGVDPRVVAQCERVVNLPMRGVKGSLNVGVAFGVASYVLAHARSLETTQP